MDFRITGLHAGAFQHLFGLGDAELRQLNARRMIVDACPGYPDRITLSDVPLGERVILLNHVSQPAATPYYASHAIFVWEGALDRFDAVNTVPEAMRRRLLSLRAFDGEGMMVEAEVVDGSAIEPLIERMFANEAVAAIHVHNARQGCFSGRVERAGQAGGVA